MDLGTLSAESELVSVEEKSRIMQMKHQLTEEETETFHDLLYDKIRVKLRKMGVYFFEDAGMWMDTAEDESYQNQNQNRERKIIDEIDLDLILENSIMPTAANLARTKLSATLPEIIVFLSDFKLQKVMTLLNQLPKSNGDAEKISQNDNGTKAKLRRTPPLKTSEKIDVGTSEDEFYDAFDDMKIGETGIPSEGKAHLGEETDALPLMANFVIEKVVLFMSKFSNDKEQLIISMLAQKLALDVTSFDTLTKVDFRLGGIRRS